MEEVREAIAKDFLLEMVYEGYSGTYKTLDYQGNIVGIFKPKDEHPYGSDNPKCLGFVLRNLMPLKARRGCNVAEQTYLTEVASYIVDRYLTLGVVPLTGVVKLPVILKRGVFESYHGVSKIGSF